MATTWFRYLRTSARPGSLTTNSFGPRVDLTCAGGALNVVVGDLDGDGKPDLAVIDNSVSYLSLFRNISTPGVMGTNSFAPRVDLPALESNQGLAAADLEGDGKLDLVTGSSSGSTYVSVYHNQATPGSLTINSFAAPVNFAMPGWVHDLAVGDLNGDGKPDILSTEQSSDLLSVFQNQSGPGGFTNSSLGARVDLAVIANPWGECVADLEGDGRPAIIFANQFSSYFSIYQNLTPFGGPVITQQPVSQTNYVGTSATFSVTAIGPMPLSYQWELSETNLPGATNTSLTLTNLQFSQAGIYAVLVTNLYGATMSSNALLVVNPYLHFVWNPIPSPRFAGGPFAVTVQAQNPTNGLATNFIGTVVFVTTNGVPVAPPVSGNFNQGAWAGTVTIAQTRTNLVLEASDSYGENGLANPINVVGLPVLVTASSGGTLYISWPMNPSGFVLETSPNLMPGSWVPVSAPPVPIGGQNLEPITITDTNAFYRLRFTGP